MQQPSPIISPKTRLFAVLGHPVAHSLSPLMHNAAISNIGMDAAYLAFDVTVERLPHTLQALFELGFEGLNLTIPLKEAAFHALTDLHESARLAGSVNTIKPTPAGLQGYSTDGNGFLRAFEDEFEQSLRNKSILMLGCGGAGRAVASACAGAGAAHVLLANRTAAKASALAEHLNAIQNTTTAEALPSSQAAWQKAALASDVVINASSAGLKPGEPSLLETAAFRRGQYVYDLVYTARETPFLCAARNAGAKTANGLSMLIHQGALSFRIWTGLEEPLAVMRAAIQRQAQH